MSMFRVLLFGCVLLGAHRFCFGQDPRLHDAEFTSIRVNWDKDGKVAEVLAGFKFPNNTFAVVVVKKKELVELAARIYEGLEITVLAQTARDSDGNFIVSALDADLLLNNYRVVESKLAELIRDEELGPLAQKDLKKRAEQICDLLESVEGLLSREQRKSLNGIIVGSDLENHGVLTASSKFPSADQLEIPREQRDAIIKLKEKLEGEFLEELETLLKDQESKILDHLTDEQKKKFAKLLGKRPAYQEQRFRERILSYLNL